MTTIRDVARAAGVSVATVSRVFSSPERVAKETRARVKAAIRRLGYEPNVAAKALRTTRTEKILVMVPDISNPFYSRIIRGVEEAASAAGYSVLLGDTRNERSREEQFAIMLRRKEADGLIFLGARLPTSLTDLVAKLGPKSPIVNGCEYSHALKVSSVHIDNQAAASEVATHLRELGHRRIGILTGPLESPLSQDRLAGVRAILADERRVALDVISGDFSIESGLAGAGKLLDRRVRPTAIFCFSDEMAMGALDAIHRRGLTCPKDVSLVGFDDIRYAQYLDPPLTTVSQPMDAIGHELVRLLFDIRSDNVTALRQITLAHRLVVRASTAVPR